MEEKLILALEYRASQLAKLETQQVCEEVINNILDKLNLYHYENGSTTKW